jgi:hypothetical protein
MPTTDTRKVNIVNLSTIHTLHPIGRSVGKFGDLCTQYSDGCLNWCPNLFKSVSNRMWVTVQYYRNSKLIQDYKLGKMDTTTFLNKLLDIFPFLKDIAHDEETMNTLNDGKSYARDNFALSLLEAAWNEIIDLEEEAMPRLGKLVALNEPIYLVSNTNELNVLKIIRLLKKHNPEIAFLEPIDISVLASNQPIKIAPNISLCLSYRFASFKTMSDTNTAKPGSTMSLMRDLVKNELKAINSSDIRVISQYPGDLAEAGALGIPQENIFEAEVFFNDAPSATMKKQN